MPFHATLIFGSDVYVCGRDGDEEGRGGVGGQRGLPARVFRWPSASISSMTLMIS